ncbi:SigE family RNA polymerase sigma factor [Nocardioides sp. 1609]|uniref:SigE family RNA polymerase sigma factor n=1 Tax=Nocardioides sp. 1609 TaxID=2508327 RepID=UPI001FD6B60D|nr:SigE family RNA polymerase sigma factor [Nocardioides sp. 1609]
MTIWTRRQPRELSFVEYVEARHAHLWRLAFALTGTRERADDLLQVALEKLYVAWPRVRDLAHPDAYARQVLVRANVDESRRPWRRETVSATAPDTRVTPDPTGAVDTRNDLLSLLQELAPMQRRCVVLRHWLDLSVAETALALNISEGSVKTHTSRGVAHLRRMMAVTASS